MYNFNDNLDTYILKPVVDGYKWITPDLLETGVSNVFSNMKDINVFLNDFLQGKFNQGAEDTGRFLINSTIGIGGLFDVATYAGLDQNDEDFGQTLAVWGVPSGPYLVLPILGPATFRGIPGAVVDTATNPVSYLGWPVAAAAALESRASAEGSLQFIDDAAVDRYVFLREAYLQNRDYLVSDGKQDNFDDELLLDYGEEDDATLGESDVLQGVRVVKTDNQHDLNKADLAQENPQNQQKLTNPAVKSNTQDSSQDDTSSPAFEEAKRSFKNATRTYKKASDELEVIKKGDQQ